MKKDIPSGYTLSITSWENDADCYKTQVFHGLEADEVRFLIEVARLFKSMNNHRDPGFGGGDWPYARGKAEWPEDMTKAHDAVVARFGAKLSAQFLETWKVAPLEEGEDPDALFDGYSDRIAELVGYPENDCYMGGNYIRVYDRHTVHYHGSTVPDVTKEFK